MRKSIYRLCVAASIICAFALSPASKVFAQHKSVSTSVHAGFKNARTLSACTKSRVFGELPKNINIPQQLCADERKPADVREMVKPENGGENRPNQTINDSDLVYGGMSADIIFGKLPTEVRQIIKLAFPEIAADHKQLYSLTVVGETFPSTGRFAKFVRNYKYTLQNNNAVNHPTMLPNLPAWTFIKQNKKLKLRYLEILTWNADEKTYK